MKKPLIGVLAAVLFCGATICARAAALETSGELRVRGWWLDNCLRNEADTEFWDQRLRLRLDWPVAAGVNLHGRADIREDYWGDNIAKEQISFDHAVLQFVWPGTPVRFSLGRQDVSWGTGYWVQADNRDRFQVAAKLDPVVVVVAYDKFTEVLADQGEKDGWRGWAVGAVTDAAGFKLGLLAAFMKDETRFRFTTGDLVYAAGDIFATGRLGALEIKAEFSAGSGQIDKDTGAGTDLSGLGAYAGVFLPVGPLSLGLEGAYARGDDPDTKEKNEGFFSADYQGPYWSVIFYNNMDYSGYASDAQTSSTAADFSVRNAITGKLSATFTPTKNLTLVGAGLYAATDRTQDGVEKAMGWEFDLIAVYGITENVSLTAAVGYALLGDYWKSAAIAGGTGDKPENPLGAMVAFLTKF